MIRAYENATEGEGGAEKGGGAEAEKMAHRAIGVRAPSRSTASLKRLKMLNTRCLLRVAALTSAVRGGAAVGSAVRIGARIEMGGKKELYRRPSAARTVSRRPACTQDHHYRSTCCACVAALLMRRHTPRRRSTQWHR